MKKKIAILGSTGSIGKTLINILKENKNNFEILLLTAKKLIFTIILMSWIKFLKIKKLIIP